MVATDDGFSAIGLIELIKPEAKVTTKKVCFHNSPSDTTVGTAAKDAHDYEKYKVRRH